MSIQLVLGWKEEEFGFHDIWCIDIPSQSKLIYLFLFDVITLQKGYYPSYATIGRCTSMSRNSAIRHVRLLEELGLLSKNKRVVEEVGAHITNEYILYHPDQVFSKETYHKNVFS